MVAEADVPAKFDVSAWPGLELVEPVGEGYRNTVWRGQLGDDVVAVRRSRRSAASLAWELDLNAYVAERGMRVPRVMSTSTGERHCEGVVVQTWLEGRAPVTELDWSLVAEALAELHGLTTTYPQRPGCCTVLDLHGERTSVDADLDALPVDIADRLIEVFRGVVDVPTAVVHGDPMDSNIRIDAGGQVGFLDWDESRVDVVWHDFSNLGVRVLDPADHERALRLSNAWETANAWVVEPDYAQTRLAQLG